MVLPSVVLPHPLSPTSVSISPLPIAKSFDKKVQKEASMKLAYTVNYYLPQYPIAEKYLVLFSNKEHFIWPDHTVKTLYTLW